MYHHVAHAVPGVLLFHTWEEGVVLFRMLCRAAPNAAAIVVMPDHFHVEHGQDMSRALQYAMRAFARWLHNRRNRSGRLWRSMPPAVWLADRQKRSRTERYIHLNAPRARLAADPLAWPLSSYRSAVGLDPSPIRRRADDVARYHEWSCRDDWVPRPAQLPIGGLVAVGDEGLHAVRAAVSSLMLAPLSELRRRGAARSQLTLALRLHSDASTSAIADFVGVTARAVRKVAERETSVSKAVGRVLYDPRFELLDDLDLRRMPSWGRFRSFN